MQIDELVRNPSSWLSNKSQAGVVISSRVRLARNLQGIPFPGWAKQREMVAVCSRVREACAQAAHLRQATFFDMGALDSLDREVLKERNLISQELLGKGAGSGLVTNSNESVSVMINEEDHVRLQAISPGMDLEAVFALADAVDSELEAHLDYAFSHKIGYLTACPTNVGTGLRVSVLLHLSGLCLQNEIEPLVNGLDKLGLAVRGLWGEGSDAQGNMFQVSNQTTLGESEQVIVQRLLRLVTEVVQHEENARLRLLETKESLLMDQIGRSFGVLLYAQVLQSRECVDLLAALRLGVEMGVVKDLKVGEINQIMLEAQPGHLQKVAGKALDSDERDELRAEVVRQRIRHVSL